jgi:serine/threonine-protein kinase HipA
LFSGKKISHILSLTRPEFNEHRLNFSEKISISGVQVKYSARLEKKKIILSETSGQYILKPVPYGPFQNMEIFPANEHLSMQIAEQVFNINTPPNCMMLFMDEEMCYVVKRFDVMESGEKLLQEDFAQLANRTEENAGKNYKYGFSYEEIAELMKKYVAAYPVEIEKFFSLVVFNYLICNGDAHLKNFSLIRNEQFGDFTLSPAYDLLNTRLHLTKEPDTALELFKNDFMTEAYKDGSKYTKTDFVELGLRVGIKKDRIERIIKHFVLHENKIEELVNCSFLTLDLREKYLTLISERRERLIK